MAMDFDGVDNYVSVSDMAPLFGDDSTTAYWIKTTQVGNDTHWLAPGVCGVEEAGGENDVFPGWFNASGFILSGAGNGPFAVSLAAVNDGAWHHIACTYNATSGEAKMYVDGVLQNTVTSATGPKTSADTGIGRQDDTGGTPTYYDGEVDDFRIYDRILSDAEIASIFAAAGGDDSIPRQRQMFDEASPGTVSAGAGSVKDSAIDKNDGTPSGTTNPAYTESVLMGGRRRVA